MGHIRLNIANTRRRSILPRLRVIVEKIRGSARIPSATLGCIKSRNLVIIPSKLLLILTSSYLAQGYRNTNRVSSGLDILNKLVVGWEFDIVLSVPGRNDDGRFEKIVHVIQIVGLTGSPKYGTPLKEKVTYCPKTFDSKKKGRI
jgi:hypothetical protein